MGGLAAANVPVPLSTGAMVFAEPPVARYIAKVWAPTREALGTTMRGWQVVCTDAFLPLVRKVVERLPGREHVKIKEEQPLLTSLPFVDSLGDLSRRTLG